MFSLWLNDKASLNYLNWTVIVNVISDTCASLDKCLKISAIRSFIVTAIEHLSTRCMVTWHIYLITCSSFLIIHTCFSLSHQSINGPAAFLLPTFEPELDPFSACCCLSLSFCLISFSSLSSRLELDFFSVCVRCLVLQCPGHVSCLS